MCLGLRAIDRVNAFPLCPPPTVPPQGETILPPQMTFYYMNLPPCYFCQLAKSRKMPKCCCCVGICYQQCKNKRQTKMAMSGGGIYRKYQHCPIYIVLDSQTVWTVSILMVIPVDCSFQVVLPVYVFVMHPLCMWVIAKVIISNTLHPHCNLQSAGSLTRWHPEPS